MTNAMYALYLRGSVAVANVKRNELQEMACEQSAGKVHCNLQRSNSRFKRIHETVNYSKVSLFHWLTAELIRKRKQWMIRLWTFLCVAALYLSGIQDSSWVHTKPAFMRVITRVLISDITSIVGVEFRRIRFLVAQALATWVRESVLF